MAIRIIESKQNPRVKELRTALLRPGRSDADSIALEGIHLVVEALRSGLELTTVFVSQGHENLLHELELNDSIEVLVLPPEVLASAVTTESPQPIAALAHPRNWAWESLLTPQTLLIVLSGIQNPGNLGTILRSAEAFGATGAICLSGPLSGTVSRWNPKAMRASAGSVFRLPTLTASENKCLERLKSAGIRTLATSSHEADPVGNQDLTGPVAIIIGSEGSGLSPELAAQCDARITIPCPGPVESLNAAVAASILLYEASRQRNSQRIPVRQKGAKV
jgi:TrmH family RNA methyltransferase